MIIITFSKHNNLFILLDVNEDILDRPVLLTKPRSSVKDVVRLKPIMEVNETLPTTEAGKNKKKYAA